TTQSTSPFVAVAGGAVGAAAGREDAGPDFGASFAAGCCPSAASSTRIGEPCDTLSPVFTFSSFTMPAAGDGISIVALSDSSVTSDCSLAIVSPGLTSTSMTSTFLTSPTSGTFTSLLATRGSACEYQRAQKPG